MKNKFIAISLCVVLTNLCFAQSKEQKQTVGNVQKLPAAKVEKIETAITAWMTQNKAPALSVAIVTDNQMSFAKGYGLADVENNVAMRSDTAYRLASIGKSIAAIAVMQLVERGKIDLNAPINRHYLK